MFPIFQDFKKFIQSPTNLQIYLYVTLPYFFNFIHCPSNYILPFITLIFQYASATLNAHLENVRTFAKSTH